jgi:hypothetical protein
MSDFHEQLVQYGKMLKNLDTWLTKAEAHAAAKKFDPAVLLQARLAPDMFPLVRQVQSCCDSVKSTAARLAGREPPKHPDTETTFEQLHARIRTVLEYIDTLKAEDFKGYESRVVPLPFMPGKGMSGADFLLEMSLPNTYFHFTTAYALLRHNGVELGKYDYLGSIKLRDL